MVVKTPTFIPVVHHMTLFSPPLPPLKKLVPLVPCSAETVTLLPRSAWRLPFSEKLVPLSTLTPEESVLGALPTSNAPSSTEPQISPSLVVLETVLVEPVRATLEKPVPPPVDRPSLTVTGMVHVSDVPPTPTVPTMVVLPLDNPNATLPPESASPHQLHVPITPTVPLDSTA